MLFFQILILCAFATALRSTTHCSGLLWTALWHCLQYMRKFQSSLHHGRLARGWNT